ncbi:hypothetical protein BDV30DRAFT_235642 [Aspergillus minisclerotigenes]|uniref:Uncharacterized protein n=1 Tax=Aspergillus minisclerotigenes TaxID=656917 RepID=A0A5N6JCI4_9EURO|nr:hypothetical protein BDV30DRAFT_235642 [Aspergillus minisclerotigenes]
MKNRHESNSIDHKPTVNRMVIISPYEAQELYPSIKDSKHVTLHLYVPRSNLGLKPLDKLDLYNVSGEVISALCIPRSFIIDLNLFAGKLYLGSYEEYVEVCDVLAWYGSQWARTVLSLQTVLSCVEIRTTEQNA